jgi:ubiquinone/menaquinone biosynthesis C-methylase UbiE
MDTSRKTKEQDFWDDKAGGYDAWQSDWQSTYEHWIEHIRSSLNGGGRLLDMGCGTGIVTLRLADIFDSISAYDVSEPMLEAAREKASSSNIRNVEWKQGDVYSLPEQAQSFDYCIGCALLDIVVDPLAVLREAHRLLKPSGVLITMTDSRFAYRYRTGLGHIGRKLLKQAGLRKGFSGNPPLVAELHELHLAAGFSVPQVIARSTDYGQVYSAIWAEKPAASA